MRTREGADQTNRICAAAGMVTADPDVMWANQLTETSTYLIAEDADTGEVIGTVTGVDHDKAFGDPESACSLWCLAVDFQASKYCVGEALVRTLAEHYKDAGVPTWTCPSCTTTPPRSACTPSWASSARRCSPVKCKNTINEPLFAQPLVDDDLNPHTRIIVDEARRRGTSGNVLDAEGGYVRFTPMAAARSSPASRCPS